jgi:hypothetical protein
MVFPAGRFSLPRNSSLQTLSPITRGCCVDRRSRCYKQAGLGRFFCSGNTRQDSNHFTPVIGLTVGLIVRATPKLPGSDAQNDAAAHDHSERLNADFRGTHITIGRHPMSFHRDRLNQLGVVPSNRLSSVPNGHFTRIAGCIICRQRPGTAKGLVFLSLKTFVASRR